jgi:hypothetical protein
LAPFLWVVLLEYVRASPYSGDMNVVLPPEQELWLNARVADGQFISPEAAVRQMIAERMAFEADDFAWAKPYVDEARAAASSGEVVVLDEALADIDSHLASLKGT